MDGVIFIHHFSLGFLLCHRWRSGKHCEGKKVAADDD